MYNKEALSALIAKIKANGEAEQAESDLRLLKEACLNACELMAQVRKYAVIRVFAAESNDDSVAEMKARKTDLLRRLSFNMAAVQAMASYYAAEQVFVGDPASAGDVQDFCNEFTNTLYRAGSSAKVD